MTGLLICVLLAFALAAFDAMGQMASPVDRGPFDLALVGTYAWVVGVSLLGGLASFYQKVKSGQARWFNFSEFLGELVTSATAGLITFWLCKASGVGEWWSAAFVGIAGHMGSRALFMLEKLFERWAGRTLDVAPAPRAVPSGSGTPGDER